MTGKRTLAGTLWCVALLMHASLCSWGTAENVYGRSDPHAGERLQDAERDYEEAEHRQSWNLAHRDQIEDEIRLAFEQESKKMREANPRSADLNQRMDELAGWKVQHGVDAELQRRFRWDAQQVDSSRTLLDTIRQRAYRDHPSILGPIRPRRAETWTLALVLGLVVPVLLLGAGLVCWSGGGSRQSSAVTNARPSVR